MRVKWCSLVVWLLELFFPPRADMFFSGHDLICGLMQSLLDLLILKKKMQTVV